MYLLPLIPTFSPQGRRGSLSVEREGNTRFDTPRLLSGNSSEMVSICRERVSGFPLSRESRTYGQIRRSPSLNAYPGVRAKIVVSM